MVIGVDDRSHCCVDRKHCMAADQAQTRELGKSINMT